MSDPSVAIAVQDIELNQFKANNFAVYPAHVNRLRAIFQWDYTASLWVRIRLNFWASANPEVQLGHLRVDNINPTQGRAFATTDLSQAFGKHQRPVIRTFINGYGLTSNVLQLATAPANLQGTRLTIGISVGPQTVLNRLYVSYIAFSPSDASFVSYGGQISQRKFAGSVSSDISNSLYHTPYVLIGLNLVSIGNNQPISFETMLGNAFHCQVSASRMVEEFSLIYIAVGVAPSKLCSACGRYAIASDNQCVTACPEGSSPFTYADSGVGCRSCPDGHVLADGKCVPGVVSTESVTTTTVRAPTTTSSTAGSSTSGGSSSSGMTSTSGSSSSGTQTVTNPADCPDNSFHNGVECVCEVGYAFISGRCQLLKMQIKTTKVTTTTTTTTTTVHQMGHDNSSSSGSSSTGTTSQPAQPSQPQPLSPVPCPAGYVRVNGNCQMNTPAQCPANAHDNGLGTCVCNEGFYFSNNVCVAGAPCPANSRRVSADKCQCNEGFNDYQGVCSRCPPGALWSSVASQCIYVCGQNSAYSAQAGKCACNPGFGMINGMCDVCPQNHFIGNGYCVTCPLHSNYNSNSKRCECSNGFFTNEFGLCVQKCGQNEEYDISAHNCRCLKGLGKVNGVCQICPAGSRPTADGSACNHCRANEELRNGQCVCVAGYAYNSAGVCSVCSSLENGFMINGVCSKCPGNKVFDGSSKCICPAGKVEVSGSTCISQCKSDELIDADGNCYSCALNQIVSNGRCVCRAGFRLSSCGVCELSCSSTEFSFQGGCAQCPLNTQFSAITNGCVCPQGYYKDTYGICQKLELRPIDCPAGQYFDTTQGCVACKASCQTCSSADVCTSCQQNGYEPDGNGVCQPKCGDGLIVGDETCDAGSRADAGCQACRIQANYTCSGQPSVCTRITPVVPVVPTPPNEPPTRTASLTQVGKVNINSNNVFITLRTNPTFTFANPTEMQSFIKADFEHGIKPTVYCSQRDSPELDVFDCLLIYPSGVPNSDFEIDFSYDKGPGKRASA